MKRFGHQSLDSYLSRAWQVGVGAVLSAAVLTATGCTSESRVVPSTSGNSAEPKFRSKRIGMFDELIERQKTSPDRSVQSTLADGVVGTRSQPLADADRVAAEMPLETVLAGIGSPKLSKPVIGPERVDEIDHKDAIAKYLSGRQKLEDGKFTEALDDLYAASKLDPLAPEPFRALAEANMGLGRTTAAMKSFSDAAVRGSTEPRLFWLLGRDALKSGNAGEAAALFNVARKTLSESPGADRAMAALVQNDLGEALGGLGHLRAMVTLRQNVLSQLREITPPQTLRNEFGDLYRRAGDLYLSNGDALWRLGDFDAATREYALAEETGLVDPGLTMSRWFDTLLQQGRTAEVADRLLSEAAEHPERLDATRLKLLRVLSQSKAGDGLRSGFSQLYSESKTPSLSLMLARASAETAADSATARTILASALAKTDAEPETVAAYLATWPVNAVSERVSGIVDLVAKQLQNAGRYAQALVAEGHDPKTVEAAINADSSLPGRLLKAQVLAAWGRFDDARLSLANLELPSASDSRLGWITTKGEIGAQSGNWPEADSAIEALTSMNTKDATLACAGIQRMLQRYADAKVSLEKIAGAKPDNPAQDVGNMDALLRGAELAARLGNGEVATALLTRAAAADPNDERAYTGLVAIASAAKPVDQQRITGIVRQLRQNCPTGRAARSMQFQQALGSGLSNLAGTQRVLEVVRNSPQDAGIVEQLGNFAERNASTNPTLAAAAESALTSVLSERPGSANVRRGLARVLASSGKYEQAIGVLDQLPAQIIDSQALRLKEKILKENLKKEAEAKAVESQRMMLAQPGIDTAIESCDWMWRANKFDEAVQRMTSRVAPGADLDVEQQAKILFLASRAMGSLSRLPEEPRQGATDDGKRALAFFDLVALHGGTLLPQHHQARLILVGVNAPTDFARLLAAANLAGEQHPTLKTASIKLVADAAGSEVPRRGGEFLQYAASTMSDVPAPIVTLIVRRAVAFGTLDDIQKALDLAEAPSRITAVLSDLDSPMEGTATPAQQQAELAYIVASGMTVNGDEKNAETVYRRALSHEPRHGLANNDLGYALLERGELEKAAPLIETAAEVLANRSHVIDSLGWLRYKQGKMGDTAATSTTPAVEGAITILKRALQIDNGNEAAMLDHLGDALWADGQRVAAATVWQQASTAAEAMLRQIQSVSATREPMVKELKGIVTAANTKLAAYRTKLEPAIAMYPGRKQPGTPIAVQEEK